MEYQMLTPDDISQYIAGDAGRYLEVSCDGVAPAVLFWRTDQESISASIPKQGDQGQLPFGIEAALSHPMCGASFELNEDAYIVQISKRSQIWSVIKIALSHLNWGDEKRLYYRFCDDGEVKGVRTH